MGSNARVFVRLASFRLQTASRKTFAEFECICLHRKGPRQVFRSCVYRRYSDFRRLHQALRRDVRYAAAFKQKGSKDAAVPAISFPPKKMVGNLSESFLLARLESLRSYMGAVLQACPDVMDDAVFLAFLGFDGSEEDTQKASGGATTPRPVTQRSASVEVNDGEQVLSKRPVARVNPGRQLYRFSLDMTDHELAMLRHIVAANSELSSGAGNPFTRQINGAGNPFAPAEESAAGVNPFLPQISSELSSSSSSSTAGNTDEQDVDFGAFTESEWVWFEPSERVALAASHFEAIYGGVPMPLMPAANARSAGWDEDPVSAALRRLIAAGRDMSADLEELANTCFGAMPPWPQESGTLWARMSRTARDARHRVRRRRMRMGEVVATYLSVYSDRLKRRIIDAAAVVLKYAALAEEASTAPGTASRDADERSGEVLVLLLHVCAVHDALGRILIRWERSVEASSSAMPSAAAAQAAAEEVGQDQRGRNASMHRLESVRGHSVESTAAALRAIRGAVSKLVAYFTRRHSAALRKVVRRIHSRVLQPARLLARKISLAEAARVAKRVVAQQNARTRRVAPGMHGRRAGDSSGALAVFEAAYEAAVAAVQAELDRTFGRHVFVAHQQKLRSQVEDAVRVHLGIKSESGAGKRRASNKLEEVEDAVTGGQDSKLGRISGTAAAAATGAVVMSASAFFADSGSGGGHDSEDTKPVTHTLAKRPRSLRLQRRDRSHDEEYHVAARAEASRAERAAEIAAARDEAMAHAKAAASHDDIFAQGTAAATYGPRDMVRLADDMVLAQSSPRPEDRTDDDTDAGSDHEESFPALARFGDSSSDAGPRALSLSLRLATLRGLASYQAKVNQFLLTMTDEAIVRAARLNEELHQTSAEGVGGSERRKTKASPGSLRAPSMLTSLALGRTAAVAQQARAQAKDLLRLAANKASDRMKPANLAAAWASSGRGKKHLLRRDANTASEKEDDGGDGVRDTVEREVNAVTRRLALQRRVRLFAAMANDALFLKRQFHDALEDVGIDDENDDEAGDHDESPSGGSWDAGARNLSAVPLFEPTEADSSGQRMRRFDAAICSDVRRMSLRGKKICEEGMALAARRLMDANLNAAALELALAQILEKEDAGDISGSASGIGRAFQNRSAEVAETPARKRWRRRVAEALLLGDVATRNSLPLLNGELLRPPPGENPFLLRPILASIGAQITALAPPALFPPCFTELLFAAASRLSVLYIQCLRRASDVPSRQSYLLKVADIAGPAAAAAAAAAAQEQGNEEEGVGGRSDSLVRKVLKANNSRHAAATTTERHGLGPRTLRPVKSSQDAVRLRGGSLSCANSSLTDTGVSVGDEDDEDDEDDVQVLDDMADPWAWTRQKGRGNKPRVDAKGGLKSSDKGVTSSGALSICEEVQTGDAAKEKSWRGAGKEIKQGLLCPFCPVGQVGPVLLQSVTALQTHILAAHPNDAIAVLQTQGINLSQQQRGTASREHSPNNAVTARAHPFPAGSAAALRRSFDDEYTSSSSTSSMMGTKSTGSTEEQRRRVSSSLDLQRGWRLARTKAHRLSVMRSQLVQGFLCPLCRTSCRNERLLKLHYALVHASRGMGSKEARAMASAVRLVGRVLAAIERDLAAADKADNFRLRLETILAILGPTVQLGQLEPRLLRDFLLLFAETGTPGYTRSLSSPPDETEAGNMNVEVDYVAMLRFVRGAVDHTRNKTSQDLGLCLWPLAPARTLPGAGRPRSESRRGSTEALLLENHRSVRADVEEICRLFYQLCLTGLAPADRKRRVVRGLRRRLHLLDDSLWLLSVPPPAPPKQEEPRRYATAIDRRSSTSALASEREAKPWVIPKSDPVIVGFREILRQSAYRGSEAAVLKLALFCLTLRADLNPTLGDAASRMSIARVRATVETAFRNAVKRRLRVSRRMTSATSSARPLSSDQLAAVAANSAQGTEENVVVQALAPLPDIRMDLNGLSSVEATKSPDKQGDSKPGPRGRGGVELRRAETVSAQRTIGSAVSGATDAAARKRAAASAERTRIRDKLKAVRQGTEPACALCNVNFNIVRRRHHCRACGLAVCGGCSPQTLALPDLGYGNARVRVCRKCFVLKRQQQRLKQHLMLKEEDGETRRPKQEGDTRRHQATQQQQRQQMYIMPPVFRRG